MTIRRVKLIGDSTIFNPQVSVLIRKIHKIVLPIAVLVGTWTLFMGGTKAEQIDIESTAVQIFGAIKATQPLEQKLSVSTSDALVVQDYLIALMRPTWGMDVGYCANMAYHSDTHLMPQTAILLENMFTGTRAIVSRAFGIDMHAAGELMFRVKSDDINVASTRQEMITAVSSVIPAVRMTDQLLGEDEADDDAASVATNLQVRMFVLGREYKLNDDEDWIQRLPQVSITLSDEGGRELTNSNSQAKRLHPIDSLLLVRDALFERGILLKPNDVVGIGIWTGEYPIATLGRLAADFEGLADDKPERIYMGFK